MISIQEKNLLIFFYLFFLIISSGLNGYCETENSNRTHYIQGTINSIDRDKIIITDTSGQDLTISLTEDTAFYDCSKPYGAGSRATFEAITASDTAVISVNTSYIAKGIIFLPGGNNLHPTWEEIMGRGNSSPGNGDNYNSTQPGGGDNYNSTQPETGSGELLNTQGIVLNINSTSLTIRTLEGQEITGALYKETLVYDMSKGYANDSTGNISSISPGDVAGISYYKDSPQKLIEAIMFLPGGTYFDKSWTDLYKQIEEGTYKPESLK